MADMCEENSFIFHNTIDGRKNPNESQKINAVASDRIPMESVAERSRARVRCRNDSCERARVCVKWSGHSIKFNWMMMRMDVNRNRCCVSFRWIVNYRWERRVSWLFASIMPCTGTHKPENDISFRWHCLCAHGGLSSYCCGIFTMVQMAPWQHSPANCFNWIIESLWRRRRRRQKTRTA